MVCWWWTPLLNLYYIFNCYHPLPWLQLPSVSWWCPHFYFYLHFYIFNYLLDISAWMTHRHFSLIFKIELIICFPYQPLRWVEPILLWCTGHGLSLISAFLSPRILFPSADWWYIHKRTPFTYLIYTCSPELDTNRKKKKNYFQSLFLPLGYHPRKFHV